ncbi:CHAT domain-containing protein [Desmonostoc muscorum LEGE 12446]|uniref:CHAT domain-containing protein n=1 Tax=Desmonostoc muscorum LEGE 12446 TaxID=1828758 RepID=A0A8J7A932_DESMC|nr:CHAT domain-containing protein [Desmonostoc muscorum]MCF2150244.1 CHAT domain-containing protein [Desmonostoc muscorum LEGE 12446]
MPTPQDQKFRRYGVLVVVTTLLCVVIPYSVTLPVVAQNTTPSAAETTQTPNWEQQAKTLYEAGRFSEAVTILQQPLEFYQKKRDILGVAVVRSNLSLNYQQLGRWKEATEEINAALTLLQSEPQQKQKSTEQLAVWAQALDVQGSLQLARGEIEQALDIWEQATTLYNQLGNSNRVTLSRLNQAQALQALGLYRQAKTTLDKLQQSLDKQSAPLTKAANLRSLGDALRVMGDLEQAQKVLQASLNIAPQPEAIAAANLSLGNVSRSQASIKTSQKNTEAAERKREEALSYYQKAAEASASVIIQTEAQLNRLRLLTEMQRWAEALSLYPQVQSQLASLSPGRSTIYGQVNFAQSLLKMAQAKNNADTNSSALAALPSSFLEEIAQILAVARQQAESSQDVRSLAFVLGNLGHLYEQTQQWSIAQNLTQKAINLSQSINASDISYRWEWQLGRILKAQNQDEAAIIAYNGAFDTLRSLRQDLAGINPDVQFSFRESVEPVYRQLVGLLLSSSVDGQKQQDKASQNNLKQAREVLEALQVAQLENFFQQSCQDITLQLDKVIDSEKDRTAAVIYPIFLEDRLEVILKLPKKQDLYRYPPRQLKIAEIQATLSQLQGNLQENGTFQEVKKDAQTVYSWLIEPAKDLLEQSGIKTLIFALDSPLRNIPMAVLYDGQQYLVEKYAVSLVLGLEVREPLPLRRSKMKVLAAGLREPPKNFSNFPELVKVNDELEAIKDAGISTTLICDDPKICNDKFTSETFNQKFNRSDFQVVHLATHGQFGIDRENTFLLAGDGQFKIDDLDKLFRTQQQKRANVIELLILSACQTATGNDQTVLGIAGTTVRAGAQSAIAGLWNLDDESSVIFTKQFYQRLGRSDISKAEALRLAQQDILKQPNYEHPRYWAPYVLVGNWL